MLGDMGTDVIGAGKVAGRLSVHVAKTTCQCNGFRACSGSISPPSHMHTHMHTYALTYALFRWCSYTLCFYGRLLQSVRQRRGANYPIMNLHERTLSVLANKVRFGQKENLNYFALCSIGHV